jgi:hypothetical protein
LQPVQPQPEQREEAEQPEVQPPRA